MWHFKRYTGKQLVLFFIGLIFFFFADDFLIVILAHQFGFLGKNIWLIRAILVFLFLASVGLAYAGISVLKKRPTTGKEGLMAQIGKVVAVNNRNYQISIHGEVWNAESASTLKIGDRVRITGIDGLTLNIEKISPS